MDLGIAGKLAVVTGASGGLGESIAQALAAEGANVMLFARSLDKLAHVASELRTQHPVRAVPVAGDMRSRDDVRRLGATVRAEFGGADILVVNTGRPPLPMREALDETDDERWEEAYRIQLWSAILVMREITPMLVQRGWGRVIAVTSASVMQPMDKHALFTVFRAGVTGYLKHLANETASRGVTVNAVCPASVETKGLRASYDLEERARRIPVRRVGKPEELAAAVAFLASRQAGYITGVSIPVDGGQTASLF
ncbi:MAG: SDR family oxidoreductase [Betaproteobacteria bacterium]|nr:SDR family oxidoreductase [Betaproteobacteria bacterium]